MKARYYAVARRLLEARADNPEEASSHPIIKEPFNAQHEAGAYTRPLLSSP
jgi:DNA methyltransferase 1-associated protein 1